MDNGPEAVKRNLRGWSLYPLQPWEGKNLGISLRKAALVKPAVTYAELSTLGYILIVSRSCYTL
jgi:hypothetical protein